MGKAWQTTIVVGCVAVSAAALMGESALIAVRAVGGAYFLTVLAIQLRRRPQIARGPWLWILAGGTLVLVSALVRLVHGLSIGEPNPFPSPAEIPAFLGYACFIAAARSFWSHRSRQRDIEAALDGFLVTAATAVVVFSAILSQYVRDGSIGIGARAGNVAYTILDLVLIGHVCRLAVGPGVRNAAWRLLAVASGLILLNDLLFLLDTTGSVWALTLARLASPVAFFFAAGAIQHPEAPDLTTAPPYRPPRLSFGRLALMATALLTLPAALLAALLRDTEPDLPVLVSGSSVLALVSLIRISLLFRSKERVADLEGALADSGRALIAANTVDEIAEVTAQTIETIVAPSCRYAATISVGGTLPRLILRIDNRLPVDITKVDSVDPPAPVGELVEAATSNLVTHLELGEAAEFGVMAVEIVGPLDYAHSLALRTMSAQISQALSSLQLAESVFANRAERRLTALVEQSSDLVTVVDENHEVIYVSPNAPTILGDRADTLTAADPLALIHRDDLALVTELIRSPSQASEVPRAVEARVSSGEGFRWFDITTRDFSDDPEVGGVVITARDITAERAAKIGLQRSEQWFRGLVQHSSDVIAVLDEAGVFTYASPAVVQLAGLSPAQLRGRNFVELLRRDDAHGLDQVRRAIQLDPPGVRNLELALARPDGTSRTAEITVTDLRDDPSVSGLVLNIRDITDRKRLEEDLRHQVMHDDLTGLGSRVQFTDQLANALGPARRPGSKVAALFVDVDDFKNVNDSLGHAAGDQLLVEISSRLLGRLRLHDRAARFGGDEFAILLTDVYGDSDVTTVADRLISELSQPVTLLGQEVQLSVSVGVAIDDRGTESPEDLLRSADVAMYEAKAQGKGRWAMFEPGMADQTLERFEISNALGAAIENDELMVYYQPIVDLESGRSVGVEALVRWDHPIRGMISPASFIPLAERNGLIVPLGRAVLQKAVTQVAQWRRDGHDIYASVNVSAVQLQREGIVAEILAIVDEAKMDRGAVVLELTESALIDDSDLVVARIDALRAAGVLVAIDDFGTGYATLKYADEFSADILKIDQTFVAKLEDQDDSTIVSTVLSIAEGMGAKTIAEGIEVPDQHRRLMTLGCKLGQGYYFSRPAPAHAIAQTLSQERDGEALAGHGH